MTDLVAVALLALAPTDSLPVPLVAVDGPAVAYTVAQYMDTTVSAWRILGDWEPGAIVESPGPGEVLVLFVPRAGEGATGVEELPPVPPVVDREERPSTVGLCGRLFSIKWR